MQKVVYFLLTLILVPTFSLAQTDRAKQIAELEGLSGIGIVEMISRDFSSTYQPSESTISGLAEAMMAPNADFANVAEMKGLKLSAQCPTCLDYKADFADEAGLGLVVLDQNTSDVVQVFNDQATWVKSGDGFEVMGYEAPPGAMYNVVNAGEFQDYRKEWISNYLEGDDANIAGVAISTVAEQAQKATMVLAASMCPGYVYPTQISLFLDTSLSFVVFDTNTGTEITIVMDDACSGFDKYLTEQLALNREKNQD